MGRAPLAVPERAPSRSLQGGPGALCAPIRQFLRGRTLARRGARSEPRVLVDQRRQAVLVRQGLRPRSVSQEPESEYRARQPESRAAARQALALRTDEASLAQPGAQ